MTIKKITIISNNLCYGPEPVQGEEIEQRLTINSKGGVWFRGYGYSRDKYSICRQARESIYEYQAERLFSLLEDWMATDPIIMRATDIGDWRLIITDVDGKTSEYNGSLCGGICVGFVDLTREIRRYVPIKNLFVFEGPLDNFSVIEKLKELINPQFTLCDFYTEVLEEIGALDRRYSEKMTTTPIDPDVELKRLPHADFELCGTLLTMLLREDHFCNGAFGERFEHGEVVPIVERMIKLLEDAEEC